VVNKILKSKFYYGWFIVLFAAVGLFFSGPGQTFSVSIFINAYIEKFGWSRSLVSTYYSLATLAAGFTLPFIGRIVDRKGYRFSLVLIASLLASAALFMSFVNTSILLIFGFFMLRLFGQGSMTLLPNALVPQWFKVNRGKALSLMSLGGVVGSAVIPPLNTWMIMQFGIQQAWWFWVAALVVIMVPIAQKFIYDHPADLGLVVDGSTQAKASEIKYSHSIKTSNHDFTLDEAMKTRSFWLMLLTMAIPSMINTGITFHIVSILMQKGHDPIFAAFILSVTALVQFPMTFVAGFVLDKVKVQYVKAINYALYFIAILALTVSQSTLLIIAYAFMHGVFNAFESVSSGVLWPNYFGTKHLASIRSLTMTSTVIGSALGPLPFAFAFDAFGSYTLILSIMLAFPLFAIIASIVSSPPRRKATSA
jgi:MFS family permease